MKSYTATFTPLPKFDPTKHNVIKEGYEFVSAEGVLEIEKRLVTVEESMLNMEDFVGMFTRENGGSNFSNVEHDLALLNGCKVRVKIEILKFPILDNPKEKEVKKE